MYQLIRSITRFSADTAMEILSGMDAATSWNPAKDPELNATDGGAFYDQFVDKRNQSGPPTLTMRLTMPLADSKGLDSQGYTKLDADMDASTAIGKIYQDAYDDVTDGDSSTGAYTDSSADAFIKAFDAAKQHYTNLSPVATANRTDKNNPYADNKAQTASKLHDDLVLAYAKLMKRADYSQLNQLYGGSDRVQISNNGLTKNVINENNETVRQQNYTLSTWLTFDDAATAAMKLSDNKDANANATYTKSEKTDQPMFKTGQAPGGNPAARHGEPCRARPQNCPTIRRTSTTRKTLWTQPLRALKSRRITPRMTHSWWYWAPRIRTPLRTNIWRRPAIRTVR